jgi:hypothetical protein
MVAPLSLRRSVKYNVNRPYLAVNYSSMGVKYGMQQARNAFPNQPLCEAVKKKRKLS